MFYLKYKGKRLEIHDDNVYAICPGCGREEKVNLQEILSCEHADLNSAAVYCLSLIHIYSGHGLRQFQAGFFLRFGIDGLSERFSPTWVVAHDEPRFPCAVRPLPN